MTICSQIFKVSPTGQRIVYERLQGYPMFYWHVNSGYIISPGQRLISDPLDNCHQWGEEDVYSLKWNGPMLSMVQCNNIVLYTATPSSGCTHAL